MSIPVLLKDSSFNQHVKGISEKSAHSWIRSRLVYMTNQYLTYQFYYLKTYYPINQSMIVCLLGQSGPCGTLACPGRACEMNYTIVH